jgi:hypothetical protein
VTVAEKIHVALNKSGLLEGLVTPCGSMPAPSHQSAQFRRQPLTLIVQHTNKSAEIRNKEWEKYQEYRALISLRHVMAYPLLCTDEACR